MATLTRTTSKPSAPAYKDYVNFLGAYKNGKRDDQTDTSSAKSSISTSTSSSSLNSDVTDCAKTSCISYTTYLENTKNKKFNPVKPNLDEKAATKKSEIFIEIQPNRSVNEVSKMFEKKPAAAKVNTKIHIFEKQVSTENKPKIADKPKIQVETRSAPPPPPMPVKTGPVPPPMPVETGQVPPPPPMPAGGQVSREIDVPPPPPPMLTHTTPPKVRATLVGGPKTRYSVSNPNGVIPNEIDRNDPMVRKLVYGTLRGLYGAYHSKANGIVATLPRNMVKKSNGVQDIIDKIASNGDLDKLNGRVNPKLEE